MEEIIAVILDEDRTLNVIFGETPPKHYKTELYISLMEAKHVKYVHRIKLIANRQRIVIAPKE